MSQWLSELAEEAFAIKSAKAPDVAIRYRRLVAILAPDNLFYKSLLAAAKHLEAKANQMKNATRPMSGTGALKLLDNKLLAIVLGKRYGSRKIER